MNIFVTVGTQLPFPRMIGYVEDIFKNSDHQLIIQTAECSNSKLNCNIKYHEFISPDQYSSIIDWCDLIISHAGMGSIITAKEYGKPIILVPRCHTYGEHRNDHQLATARKFEKHPNIEVAGSSTEIKASFQRFSSNPQSITFESNISQSLLCFLKSEIETC